MHEIWQQTNPSTRHWQPRWPMQHGALKWALSILPQHASTGGFAVNMLGLLLGLAVLALFYYVGWLFLERSLYTADERDAAVQVPNSAGTLQQQQLPAEAFCCPRLHARRTCGPLSSPARAMSCCSSCWRSWASCPASVCCPSCCKCTVCTDAVGCPALQHKACALV